VSAKYVLDASGEPRQEPDLLAWARWFEASGDERRVALTDIAPGVRVSTVFLGLDHSFGGMRPLIFETLVFGGALDQEMDRYSTRAEAIAGHERMVARVRAAGREEGR